MTKRNYTLSTTDREAFLRAVDALAGVGTFTIHVIEVKEPPIASKPPATGTGWKDAYSIGSGPPLSSPDGAC